MAYDGRMNIKNHLKCTKDNATLAAAGTSSKILSYFKEAGPSNKDF